MKPKLIIASSNKGKIAEFRQILGGRFEIVPLCETSFTGVIEETGKTFFDNALIKAKAVCGALNEAVLADDSGLCVDALNGAPGIFSARYAGAGATAEENNVKLLAEMKGILNRKAKFAASIVMFYPDGKVLEGYGETGGFILTEPTGSCGFGYDPLFFSQELGKSFGLAMPEEKNSISHRGRALADLLSKL